MASNENPFEPITIEAVDTERVGTPKNDGTPGCALYMVPIKLSKTPSSVWGRFFVQYWDNPTSFSSMHRPGIASVRGDCVILDGTTLEEVRDTHTETLKAAVAAANEGVVAADQQNRNAQAAAKQRSDAHRDHVEGVAKDIKFD